jgi:hypothetical protein
MEDMWTGKNLEIWWWLVLEKNGGKALIEADFQEKYVFFVLFQIANQSTIVYISLFHQSTIVD